MAKKKTKRRTKSKRASKHLTPPAQTPEELFGGHRDLAELMSIDYGLIAPKGGWDTLRPMFDMDRLTALLQEVDPKILGETINNKWLQGFLMGMLHQLTLIEMLPMTDPEEEDPE